MNPTNKTKNIDIHNLDYRIEKAINVLKNGKKDKKGNITGINSAKNIQLIMDFERQILREKLSKARRSRIISALDYIGRNYIKKDFDQVTREDINKFQEEIEESNYSNWTKSTFYAILKKFFKWLKYGNDYREEEGYPEVVKGLKVGVKSKDRPIKTEKDILTEEEIEQMINNAETIRDKCFISMIYELGARVGEIGNLKYEDCQRTNGGYNITLNGKTGPRTPLLILSDYYLSAWLEQHPIKKPGSPLWIMSGKRNKEKPMTYASLNMLLRRIAHKCKITKRMHPHIFRHSRVTHLTNNGIINDQQAKKFFGWTPDSTMLGIYSHLTMKNVNDVLKKEYGIEEKDKKKEITKTCSRCQLVNPKGSCFCKRCGLALEQNIAFDLKEKEEQAVLKIMQILEKKGIMQEVAREMAKDSY